MAQPPDQPDRELLVALVSHELRTPVTVIKGFTDTLAEHWDSLDDDARREAVGVLRQRTDELVRLVDRLLSAFTGGATFGRGPTPFDLVDALRSAVDQLPADLRPAVRVALPAALPKACGDESSIALLLTELVTNALRYSASPAQVTLTAGVAERTVFFEVADRGIGIRPEHVEHVFERFWQADPGGHSDGGAGLGLYLVRHLVDRQNGRLSLRRRHLGGTVAEIRLPRADVVLGEA